MTFYSPAQTAEKTGFSIDTLRYYEKIGLLDRIDRTAAGRRRFSSDDLGFLGVLRCLRDTGMPIAEMRRYAELARGGDATLDERIALLEAHDERIDRQLETLRSQREHLRGKIQYYRDVATTA
ncbi:MULTISPECIES: MerR family transcriptional regulator [Actinoallomurus]|uniref:MerR family transcriptional regulator n=1 Tax=Actinoallomurus TaxID=667113 RepID=UPI0020901945|nr:MULTISPECIES: MerR family transcriptional regulator [Actinoallomurus]MCO5973995.1 MerR family transcriptional regulator [Actinoallomurus soli]MCO5992501.1 MerR family transcriptional regulator [Actinoallomurus rhizosphaericola]